MKVIRFFAAMFGLSSLLALTHAAEITPAEFEKLHGDLVSAKEPWQNLAWELSLVQASARAARENKPVYLLCRSGHPLGCV